MGKGTVALGNLDSKAQARLQALTGWAVIAAESGFVVPDADQLEKVAAVKSAEVLDFDSNAVLGWAATLNWLMSQATFGLVDPHMQLPDELKVPSGTDLKTITSVLVLDDAMPLERKPSGQLKAKLSREREKPATLSRVPKWELAAMVQVREAIARYMVPLSELRSRDANEGDTRLVVKDMLCEGLDYDKFNDLTTEYMVKQDFADYGVRIDKQLVAFIEVKRISQKLNERHLRQVQMYAVNEGVEWMVLTNGSVWQAYHLTGGLPVVVNMAFEVDLLGPKPLETNAAMMFFLHREALKRRRIDDLWKHRAATEPGALLGLILAEPMLEQIRKEVKRRTGIVTTAEALSEVIRTEIVDPKLIAKLYKS
ncbi:hypothetical protein [Arthrobacter cryoconiti]|uniref:Type I restriction enzyme R protein N-terminal domain-containing protein n=1 Tax=Arthrobacter cryoconiti TaxID=748907 RepID=A0ABV8QZR3_9MICC|nr:type I restriction enzyme HsdR N-terminal domain-containing protein [Arthrobacter cryoconiti]